MSLDLIQIIIFTLIIIITAILFFCYIRSDKILLRWYNAHEIGHDEPAYVITSELAKKAGVKIPKPYLIESPAINSFSINKKNCTAVILTTASIEKLNNEELEAIIAYELAYIKLSKKPGSFISVIAGIFPIFSTVIMNCSLLAGFGQENDPAPRFFKSYGMALVGPFSAAIIQLTTSRKRVFSADAYSAQLCGKQTLINTLNYFNENGYIMEINPAHAHLFFINPLNDLIFNTLYNTHPSIKERIQRLKGIYL